MALALKKSLQLLIVLIGIVCLVSGNASAAKRVALVIGNSDYSNASSLPNPTNDADAMSSMLQKIGFEVSKIKDVGYTQMRLALREFASKASTADIALVFYAGHGMEVNKHNYLIPSDAKLASDRDIDFETVPLDLVSQAAGGAKVLSLVLLDACRDNPFASSMKRTMSTRSIGRGLAKVEPTTGTLISFAAKEGTVAADGIGKNSPYTTALMNHLQQPGLEINLLFRKIRGSVLRDTNGAQEPFTYSSLPEDQIYLVEPENIGKKLDRKKPELIPSGIQKEILTENQVRAVYNDIKESKNIEVLQIFIDQYRDTIYAKFVSARINSLKSINENTNLSDPKLLWLKLSTSYNISDLQKFHTKFLNTKYAQYASNRITQINRLNSYKMKNIAQKMWLELSTSRDLAKLLEFSTNFQDTEYSGYAKNRIKQLQRVN